MQIGSKNMRHDDFALRVKSKDAGDKVEIVPGNFQQYEKTRKDALDEAVAGQITSFLGDMSPIDSGILQPALNGGKKIRGILLCLVNDTLGGKREPALLRAVAVELIHAASLIHDDYVDQDRIRRHMPAVWTLTGARNAVLLGDVIFASAIEMMSELGRDDVCLISKAIAKVSGGALLEQIDPFKMAEEIQSKRWFVDRYEKIISLKTGVLFGTACELGAVSTETDGQIRQHWFRYGSRLGEAYQVADDIHDIKSLLAERTILPEKLAPLAPALLNFVEEMRSMIPTLLCGESVEINARLDRYFRLAINRMEKEIEVRLQSAVREVRSFLGAPFGPLAYRAPWDVIAMFSAR